MRQDRFLQGLVLGLCLLAVAAVVLVVNRAGSEVYFNQDTPEAVVHDYVLALQRGDLDRAYGYLAEGEGKPDWLTFRRWMSKGDLKRGEASVRVGEAEVKGDEASVQLTVFSTTSGPFFGEEIMQRSDEALLVRQDGEWRLSYMPFEFWGYDWYLNVLPPPIRKPQG